MTVSEIAQRDYIKHPSLLETEVVESRLIYVPESDTFYALNLSATLVWVLLDQYGAFGGGHRPGALTQLENWFSNPPSRSQLEQDVDEAVRKFIEVGMLVERPDSLTVNPTACPLHETKTKYDYSPPSLTTYDSEWMKSTHPYYFHSLLYSDMWGPSLPAGGPGS